MTTLRTLKKLLLGETWWLPIGIGVVVAGTSLLVRPLAAGAWDRIGGFVVLIGVVGVLLTSVARGATRR